MLDFLLEKFQSFKHINFNQNIIIVFVIILNHCKHGYKEFENRFEKIINGEIMIHGNHIKNQFFEINCIQ